MRRVPRSPGEKRSLVPRAEAEESPPERTSRRVRAPSMYLGSRTKKKKHTHTEAPIPGLGMHTCIQTGT